MSEFYQPPFTMTEEITNLVIELGEQVGAVASWDSLQPNPTIFVTFMLRIIRDALAEIIANQNSHRDVGINVGANVGINVRKILEQMKSDVIRIPDWLCGLYASECDIFYSYCLCFCRDVSGCRRYSVVYNGSVSLDADHHCHASYSRSGHSLLYGFVLCSRYSRRGDCSGNRCRYRT